MRWIAGNGDSDIFLLVHYIIFNYGGSVVLVKIAESEIGMSTRTNEGVQCRMKIA